MKKAYIYWAKDAQKKTLSIEEWNDYVQTLDFDCRLSSASGIRTIRSVYSDGYWHFDSDKNSIYRYNSNTNEPEIITWREYQIGGFEARRVFSDEMEKSGSGKFQKRFGALECNENRWRNNELGVTNLELVQAIHDINRCVGPFIGNEVPNKTYYGSKVWKADVKSAYPACALDRLPDLHSAELVRGLVEPSEEYPIVYYLDSHNIAEFGVFDTRRERFHHLYKNYRCVSRNQTKYKNEAAIRFGAPAADELCLRCKYAECGLPEFQYFYDLKEKAKSDANLATEGAIAKQVMVYTIGTLDFVVMDEEKKHVAPSKYSYLGHIRALVLARHNHKMIGYYNEIKSNGWEFICIQTDSLMWRGSAAIPSAKHTNKLGELNLEIEGGLGYFYRLGCYFVDDENKREIKHQGVVVKDKQKLRCLADFIKFMETAKNPKHKPELDITTLLITVPMED